MEESIDAEDQIAQLPVFIIHHIMSFLSAKEVARTSILSKKWKYLCDTFPVLDFDQTYFIRRTMGQSIFLIRRKNKRFCQLIDKFNGFVDASLLRFCQFNLSIQKFRLFTSLPDVKESSSLVDRWIGLAVDYEVKELDFEVLNCRDAAYILPETIFSAKLVDRLRLGGCKLEKPSATIRFYSLKKLILDEVCISKQMVQKLISECLLLEDFSFFNCWGLKHLCVLRAPPKLKIMSIKGNREELERVEIGVSSLQQLNLEFSPDRTPRVIDLAGCTQLRKLQVIGFNQMDQVFCHLISKFVMLEDLFLVSCYSLKRLTISSNQLKKLRICCCDSLKELNLDTPNLLLFAYENNPIPTSPINALCPWIVKFNSKIIFETEWCLNLREFLGVKNQVETLKIAVKPNMNSFSLEKFSESCLSLPCKVGNLDLYIEVPPSDCRIMLDGLFWICYPRTLSVHTWPHKAQHELFKLLYSELKDRDVKCCNSKQVKCWRHYLKDIKIRFRQYRGKISDIEDFMKRLSKDNLMDVWPILPEGVLWFHLDWCFPMPLDEA